MLEYLAEREGTTVSDVLVRELEDVASGRAEELSAAIPGFGAALEWLSRRNGRADVRGDSKVTAVSEKSHPDDI